MYVCALEDATQPAQVHGEQKTVGRCRGTWPESQRSRRGTYWRENQDQDIFHVNKTYLLDYKLNAQTMQTLIFIAAVVCL